MSSTNYCIEYDLYLDRSAACGICVENAYFLHFLLLLSLIPVSALTSAWLVAKFVYEPHMRQATLEEVDSDDELFAKLKKPEQVKKSIEKKKTETAAVRSNKYRRVGKINEMVLLQQVKSKEEPKKKMTFSDWVNFSSKNSKTV